MQVPAACARAQNTSIIIQHPAGTPVENPKLELIIGPSVNRTLLEAVLGGAVGNQMGKVQSFVSKIETGERYLDVLEFLHWCEVAHADAYDVLRRVQETKRT